MKKATLIEVVACVLLVDLGFIFEKHRLIFSLLTLIPSTIILIDVIKDWKKEKAK